MSLCNKFGCNDQRLQGIPDRFCVVLMSSIVENGWTRVPRRRLINIKFWSSFWLDGHGLRRIRPQATAMDCPSSDHPMSPMFGCSPM